MGSDAMTIRAATSSDTAAVTRLAASSRRPRPRGTVLLAEHDGEMLAAIAVSSGAVLTEPGMPVADAVHRLRRRRYQLMRQSGDLATGRTLLRRLAAAPLAA